MVVVAVGAGCGRVKGYVWAVVERWVLASQRVMGKGCWLDARCPPASW